MSGADFEDFDARKTPLSDAQRTRLEKHLKGNNSQWYKRRARAARKELEDVHRSRRLPKPTHEQIRERIVDSILGSKKWRKFVEDETVFENEERRDEFQAHGEDYVKDFVDENWPQPRRE